MLLGYARVSTDDQNLNLQMDALQQAGCAKIYSDHLSGVKAARPGLSQALEVARAGDVLVVWRLDRLGRSLKDLIEIMSSLDDRGIELSSLLLMLYSVVDDRSGVCYQEYHCVYGEDVEAALRFLFNAMTAKTTEGFPFQGIPEMIYTDNGPIAKSQVFQNVMDCLRIKLVTHMPNGKDGRRVTARSKGKVERPFRTVKEAYETLYHFHEPENEVEANLWLRQYLLLYNDKLHRELPHSRTEDWLRNLPKSGLRSMCSWERFCNFAREPQRRKVGADARVLVEGIAYEVEPDLAGETVVLWWGLFDNELYVEFDTKRYGPFYPVDGPIPLHRYRKHKKTKTEERADRIADLAKKLGLPRTALDKNADLQFLVDKYKKIEPTVTPFNDPDPFQEFIYPSILLAKLAISDYLALPLAKLSTEQMVFIDALLTETLNKKVIIDRVRKYFQKPKGGELNAY